MKNLYYYLRLPYHAELIPDETEGGFVVAFPDLPGCLSQGESVEEAYRNATEAKKIWLEAAIEEGVAIREPAANRLEAYSGQFNRVCARMQKRRRKHEPVLRLSPLYE